MFNYEPGKVNYIVPAFHEFKDNISGGNVALHRLAYELANRNNNVLVFTKPEYPHPNITSIKSKVTEIEKGLSSSYSWEGFTYPNFNTVTIMPEVMKGNFFGTKYISRWILYHTRQDIEQSYGSDEVYFNYGTFNTFREVKDRRLTVFDYHLNELYNENKKRKGFCHLLHKTTPSDANVLLSKFDSVDISGWYKKGGFDFLREELNKYEYFLTYDQKTFISLAATLCGTKVIVLNPDKNTLPMKYRIDNPIFAYGVAYGLSDISWANQTIGMVRGHIEELSILDGQTIDNFDNFWREKLNVKKV